MQGRLPCASLRCVKTFCEFELPPGTNFPEDASWAVLPDPRTKSVEVKPFNEKNAVGFRTASLDVRVERDPLRLVVRDLSGNVICADAMGRPVEFAAGGFSLAKEMPDDEHYFGLGDKTGTFDRRNSGLYVVEQGHRRRRDDRSSLQKHPVLSSQQVRGAATGYFSITPGAVGLTLESSRGTP